MHPTAPLIRRQGEVDAWDNADFRAAVEATGKKQIILAGIVTEVCKFALPIMVNEIKKLRGTGTSFLALSLREAGYEVWANTDASGTLNDKIAADANRRMENAGVTLMSMFGIVCDLMRDWRNTPGALEVLPFLDT
jgi:nicotinamidase-related amidase